MRDRHYQEEMEKMSKDHEKAITELKKDCAARIAEIQKQASEDPQAMGNVVEQMKQEAVEREANLRTVFTDKMDSQRRQFQDHIKRMEEELARRAEEIARLNETLTERVHFLAAGADSEFSDTLSKAFDIPEMQTIAPVVAQDLRERFSTIFAAKVAELEAQHSAELASLKKQVDEYWHAKIQEVVDHSNTAIEVSEREAKDLRDVIAQLQGQIQSFDAQLEERDIRAAEQVDGLRRQLVREMEKAQGFEALARRHEIDNSLLKTQLEALKQQPQDKFSGSPMRKLDSSRTLQSSAMLGPLKISDHKFLLYDFVYQDIFTVTNEAPQQLTRLAITAHHYNAYFEIMCAIEPRLRERAKVKGSLMVQERSKAFVEKWTETVLDWSSPYQVHLEIDSDFASGALPVIEMRPQKNPVYISQPTGFHTGLIAEGRNMDWMLARDVASVQLFPPSRIHRKFRSVVFDCVPGLRPILSLTPGQRPISIRPAPKQLDPQAIDPRRSSLNFRGLSTQPRLTVAPIEPIFLKAEDRVNSSVAVQVELQRLPDISFACLEMQPPLEIFGCRGYDVTPADPIILDPSFHQRRPTKRNAELDPESTAVRLLTHTGDLIDVPQISEVNEATPAEATKTVVQGVLADASAMTKRLELVMSEWQAIEKEPDPVRRLELQETVGIALEIEKDSVVSSMRERITELEQMMDRVAPRDTQERLGVISIPPSARPAFAREAVHGITVDPIKTQGNVATGIAVDVPRRDSKMEKAIAHTAAVLDIPARDLPAELPPFAIAAKYAPVMEIAQSFVAIDLAERESRPASNDRSLVARSFGMGQEEFLVRTESAAQKSLSRGQPEMEITESATSLDIPERESSAIMPGSPPKLQTRETSSVKIASPSGPRADTTRDISSIVDVVEHSDIGTDPIDWPHRSPLMRERRSPSRSEKHRPKDRRRSDESEEDDHEAEDPSRQRMRTETGNPAIFDEDSPPPGHRRQRKRGRVFIEEDTDEEVSHQPKRAVDPGQDLHHSAHESAASPSQSESRALKCSNRDLTDEADSRDEGMEMSHPRRRERPLEGTDVLESSGRRNDHGQPRHHAHSDETSSPRSFYSGGATGPDRGPHSSALAQGSPRGNISSDVGDGHSDGSDSSRHFHGGNARGLDRGEESSNVSEHASQDTHPDRKDAHRHFHDGNTGGSDRDEDLSNVSQHASPDSYSDRQDSHRHFHGGNTADSVSGRSSLELSHDQVLLNGGDNHSDRRESPQYFHGDKTRGSGRRQDLSKVGEHPSQDSRSGRRDSPRHFHGDKTGDSDHGQDLSNVGELATQDRRDSRGHSPPPAVGDRDSHEKDQPRDTQFEDTELVHRRTKGGSPGDSAQTAQDHRSKCTKGFEEIDFQEEQEFADDRGSAARARRPKRPLQDSRSSQTGSKATSRRPSRRPSPSTDPIRRRSPENGSSPEQRRHFIPRKAATISVSETTHIFIDGCFRTRATPTVSPDAATPIFSGQIESVTISPTERARPAELLLHAFPVQSGITPSGESREFGRTDTQALPTQGAPVPRPEVRDVATATDLIPRSSESGSSIVERLRSPTSIRDDAQMPHPAVEKPHARPTLQLSTDPSSPQQSLASAIVLPSHSESNLPEKPVEIRPSQPNPVCLSLEPPLVVEEPQRTSIEDRKSVV
jgi:hypothetical protein